MRAFFIKNEKRLPIYTINLAVHPPKVIVMPSGTFAPDDVERTFNLERITDIAVYREEYING